MSENSGSKEMELDYFLWGLEPVREGVGTKAVTWEEMKPRLASFLTNPTSQEPSIFHPELSPNFSHDENIVIILRLNSELCLTTENYWLSLDLLFLLIVSLQQL